MPDNSNWELVKDGDWKTNTHDGDDGVSRTGTSTTTP
jgi:hypothetical protein